MNFYQKGLEISLTGLELYLKIRASFGSGAIAQLGERCSGTAEVGGSIPPSSTIKVF